MATQMTVVFLPRPLSERWRAVRRVCAFHAISRTFGDTASGDRASPCLSAADVYHVVCQLIRLCFTLGANRLTLHVSSLDGI